MTDINSEKATSVSVSAGTATLLKWAQKIKKVRMCDLMFFSVPGAYKYFWVYTAADKSELNW